MVTVLNSLDGGVLLMSGEVESLRLALGHALQEGCMFYEGPEEDPHYGEQLLRDNAIRLLETVQLAEPFLRSPKPRVLECGAGQLYVIEALRWRYGDKLDLYAIEHPGIANDALPGMLARRDVEFTSHDLTNESPPWPGVEFDLIVLTEVIEHIPPTELPQMVRRLASCLGQDGALLMSSPNPQAIWNILSLAIGNGQMLDVAFPTESGAYGHIRMYARKEVEELLAYAGLQMHEWRLSNWMHAHPSPGAPARERIRLWSQRVIPRVVPRWSSAWICTATRDPHSGASQDPPLSRSGARPA